MLGLSDRFFENKVLLFSAAVFAFIVAALLILLVFRLAFGRRLRMGGGGRSRQPRLGVVDAFDLDRQRQLVIIRRDNVEHLIMIGGPNDIVIEAEIVRAEAREATRREITAVVPWPPGSAPAQPQAPAAAPAAPAIEQRPAAAPPAPPVVLPDKVAPEENTVVLPGPPPPPPPSQPSPASPRPSLFPSLRKTAATPPRPAAPALDAAAAAPSQSAPKLNGPLPPAASPPVASPPIAPQPLSPGRVPGPPGFLRPPPRVMPSIGTAPPVSPTPPLRPSAPPPIAPAPAQKPSEPAPAVPADMLDSLEEEMAKLLGRNPKDEA